MFNYIPRCFLHLEPTNDIEVILEDAEEEGNPEQLWKKGKPNNEGYFTLENCKVPKVMTAISTCSLEIKGNIHVSLGPN